MAILLIILTLTVQVIWLFYESTPPAGFHFNYSVDRLISEKLDEYPITEITPNCAKIGDIEIWHHRDDKSVITLYGHHIGSEFDRGCATRRTVRKFYRKLGGKKKIRQIQYEYEQKYLKEALEKNK